MEAIGFIIFIVFLVISVIGQLIAKVQEAQREVARRANNPPVPRPAQPRRDSLEDEIGEFLQRTAQRRNTERPSQPTTPPPPRTITPPPSPFGRPPLPSTYPATPTSGQPVVQAEVIPSTQDRVATHVRKYMAGGKFDKETTALGSEVGQADEKLQEHLRQTFDHKLGSLTSQSDSAGQSRSAPEVMHSAAGSAATALIAMLSNPVTARQAVILSEIMNRPDQRWG